MGGDARYETFATLGRGGMADVFLAVSRGPRGFNKLVVLKKLRAHLTEDPAFREMFLDEARLAARLNHPNVVLAYEVGEGGGGYFIAMEYLDGQPLNRLLDALRGAGERMDPGIAVRIAADACSGLAHAHELTDYDGTPLRIIHRDVSPHNIFVTYEGQVKLVDFGIAKASLSRTETEVGVLKGKVAYMAPEQALGEEIDARADLFAMGVVLWEMLTGRPLFNADNAANTLHRLMNEPMPSPTTVVPDLDPALDAVVMRALEKDPERRFASARELRTALESWLEGKKRAVRSEECGALVSSKFGAARAAAQSEIRKHMASEIGFGGKGASGPPLDTRGGEEGAKGGLLDLSAGGVRTGTAVTRPSAVEGKKRNGVAVLTAVAVFGLAILLFFEWHVPRSSARSPALPLPAASSEAVSEIAAPVPLPSDSIPLPPFPSASSVGSSSAANDDPPAAAHPGHAAPRGNGHRATNPSSAPPPATGPTPASANGVPGFLTLDTYPWSRVSENGRVLGTTPLVRVPLSPGAHALTLDNPELGIHQSYTATIASGQAVTKRLGLK